MPPSTTSLRKDDFTMTHAFFGHAWPLLFTIAGFVLRAPARTAARIFRAAAWSWLLKREGVPASRRRELVDDAAERDLKSS